MLQKAKNRSNMWLLICNVLLMAATVLFVSFYSTSIRQKEEEAALGSFCNAVESMQQVSVNYLQSEQRYVEDWAAYIEANEMSEDEALEYIREFNTRSDRQAHIVDLDTLEARSTHVTQNGSDEISCYKTFKTWADNGSLTNQWYLDTMQKMMEGKSGVIGRYRVSESQIHVIGVGTGVRLREPDGSFRKYLLVCAIRVESVKQNWIFPLTYSAAEIGLISDTGIYMIPSRSMRSENFIEFIRGYNYQDDYNGAAVLKDLLRNNEHGVLQYKDSRGQPCYWYYTRLQGYDGVDIVGCIPEAELNVIGTDWSVVLVVTAVLLLLGVIDGNHILGINRRLKTAAEQAEQASEAKTQFLSSMSHDIRTPLNAVLGMTELARKRVEDTDYVRQCLEKISISGNHLLTLINDVLEISKIESGRTVIAPEPFVVEELVTNMDEIVRAQADAKGVSFTLNVHDITRPCLVGDRLRLSQVYLNLLTNAVKYTPKGGKVWLEMWEEPQENDLWLYCKVVDTGMGMSPEFQKTMYDSFSRATDSRIDKIQGTGLGLAIARQLIDQMHGGIQCQSALGKGTTFTVFIPLPIAQEKPEELQMPQSGQSLDGQARKERKILVAEDNDLNWEIVAAMLEEYHLHCTRAENGRECVEMLEAAAPGTYDMVLMDMQMPVMNGQEATRMLRQSAREDLRTIPIAAMTANAFAEDVKECLDAGMDAHLAKPVDIQKILTIIDRLCRK